MSKQAWLRSGIKLVLLFATVGISKSKQSTIFAMPRTDGSSADDRTEVGDGAPLALGSLGVVIVAEGVGQHSYIRGGVFTCRGFFGHEADCTNPIELVVTIRASSGEGTYA
jgi:hypothetical protein